MSIGEAKRIYKRTGQPVLITDPHGRPVRSELFSGVPYLLQRPERMRYQRLVNSSGHRPYIKAKHADRWVWRPYKPEPADIIFTPAELAFAEPYRGSIMLEPSVKDIGHKNKDWGLLYWLKLANAMHSDRLGPVIQCVKEPTIRGLPHAKIVTTKGFRLTAAVLSVCKAYVGPEGGLHHAAAAVGVPAVVIYGGFISPNITGYAQHRNLFTGGEPCGMRTDCPHCRKAMLDITPSMVLKELKEILA